MDTHIRKKGFTLVELSIVLVIIGLLIGGILVAQSMIETAKIGKFIRQIDQYDISITNFQSKYNSLPGDSTLLPNPGDGDGKIEDSYANSGNASVGYFNYEVSNAWQHLAVSGILPDSSFSNDASAGIRAGVNIPQMVFGLSDHGKAPGAIIYRDPNNFAYAMYHIADFSKSTSESFNITGNTRFYNVFTPFQVLSIDKKIDDGLRTTSGKVVGYDGDFTGKCYSGTAYLKNNNIECMILIRIARDIGGISAN